MKNFKLSVVAVMAMSTFAVAGGDITPVEPMVETVAPVLVSDAGFYAGIAYGMVNTEIDGVVEVVAFSEEIDHDTLMLQAGYQFNSYLAVEGRYWTAVGDADFSATIDFGEGVETESGSADDDSSAWGIYLKPMYPVTNALTAYALVGYGNVDIDLTYEEGGTFAEDESGFQWGLGASYDVNDNFAVFVDYVAMYDDDITFEGESLDVSVDSWNFGVTYKF